VSQSKLPSNVDSYFECRDIRHRVLGLRQGVAESIVTFVGGNVTVSNVVNNPSSATLGSNSSVSMPVVVKDLDNFWRGVDVVYAFRKDMVDGGGTTYSCVSNTGNNAFGFTTPLDIYFACQS